MKTTSPDKEYVPCLQAEGNVLFLDTWYPTQGNFEVYPHNKMKPHNHWNLHQIQFPRTEYGVQEEIVGKNISASLMCFSGEVYREIRKSDIPMKDVPTVLATTGYTSDIGRR